MKRKILRRDFFLHSSLILAPKILGKILVRKAGGKVFYCFITETEAYEGISDKASHASKGKTKRSETMFESGGCWYVYLTYGIHWMLNFVCGRKDYPAAVLIRKGLILNKKGDVLKEINGPGLLTKYLKINKSLNGLAVKTSSGLWIEDWGVKIYKEYIKTGKRIGVDYAGRFWASKKWRFYIEKPESEATLSNFLKR